MIKSRILKDRDEIERVMPACVELAVESGAVLPFNYMYFPFLWWDHFNNLDNTLFSEKRGENFLGVQSSLGTFFLIIAEDNGKIVGATPLGEFSVKVARATNNLRALSFAGDHQLMPYQDFLVLPSAREDILVSMFDKLLEMLKDHYDFLVLSCIPDNSLNLQFIQKIVSRSTQQGVIGQEKITAHRGGVWPWTIKPLVFYCKRLLAKSHGNSSNLSDLANFIKKLESKTLSLFFLSTRKSLESEIINILNRIDDEQNLFHEKCEIKKLLSHRPIIYPYIALPSDAGTFFMSLSKKDRQDFRRYKRKFERQCGYFEKISSKEISDKDINDYISLHLLRWDKGSASVKSSYSIKFHTELCKTLSASGLFTLFFANYNGKRIAAGSCIDIFPRREAYITGRDPNYGKLRAGILLMMENILDAIDNGFHTYELGGGWGSDKMTVTKKYHTSRSFLLTYSSDLPEVNSIFPGYMYMGNEPDQNP
ncbi:MAG: GNAT family N-acetyltransferase [Deltaproteobacteria bacterium]|nr:GNAT family N-acetyltransferase [Deltaproteobacteria bacterium]